MFDEIKRKHGTISSISFDEIKRLEAKHLSSKLAENSK